MSLETASYVANLVTSNPDGGDQRSTTDDHLRLIKAVLVRTFPKLDAAVSLSATQVMYLNDLSASVQLQLNQLRDGSATANNALYANSASFATRASRAESASFATFAARAESASYAALAGTATTAGFAQSASFAATAATATNATNASNATNATNAQFATDAGFATSAGSAALLTGLAPSDTGGANTIAARESHGDLVARYFKSTAPTGDVSVGEFVVLTSGDPDYFHRMSAPNVAAYLETRNISSRTGTTKTLSSSAPSGGGNGDIWYQY